MSAHLAGKILSVSYSGGGAFGLLLTVSIRRASKGCAYCQGTHRSRLRRFALRRPQGASLSAGPNQPWEGLQVIGRGPRLNLPARWLEFLSALS